MAHIIVAVFGGFGFLCGYGALFGFPKPGPWILQLPATLRAQGPK